MKIAIFLMAALLIPTLVSASATFLPILNQDDFSFYNLLFKSPDHIITDVAPSGVINFTEEDPLWSANYSSIDGNGFITSFKVNESQYCANGGSGNASWNQSLASSLYYPLGSNPSGYLTGFVEQDPLWSANYSLMNQWNVNSSNISNYCMNFYNSSYLYSYNIYTYNASDFTTPTNCSALWGSSCNSTILNDASMGCNGTQHGTHTNPEHVVEVYINTSAVYSNYPVNVTCEYHEDNNTGGYPTYEWIWYYNGTDWATLYYNDSCDTGLGYCNITQDRNKSIVFNVNSTEGIQVIRCAIGYNFNTGSNSYCISGGTTSSTFDTDDVNFTVVNGENNITVNGTAWNIFNATANNSIYFNGLATSYFYPYSNPLGFINASQGGDNTSWNQTLATSLYSLKGEPLWSGNYSALNASWSSTFNSTYDAFVTANISATSNNSLYCYGKTEANLNVNDTGYLNHKLEANLNVNNSVYCNGATCLLANAGNVSNNTLFFNGQGNTYFWNITGGIPFTNLTGFNLNEAWTGTLGSGNITINQNLNMSNYNTSEYLISNSIPICHKTYNSTQLLWCDCKNATNAWMANTC